MLVPSAEVCAIRNESRAPEEQFFFGGHEALMQAMREAFGGVGWWLDTSAMTLDATMDLIIAHASHLASTSI